MSWRVYVGGFGKTIEIFDLLLDENDVNKTKMNLKESFVVTEKPAFINIENDVLYSVHEIDSYNGEKTSCISAHKVQQDGSLVTIQTKPSTGVWPCHISFHSSRKFMYIPNYFSGHFEVASIQKDGTLCEGFFKHQFPKEVGSGVDKERQLQSHPHGVALSSDHIYVTDLGADKIWHYIHSKGTGFDSMVISPADNHAIETPPGTGPRHMVFHPTFNLAFVVGELNCEVIVYRFDQESGNLEKISSQNYLYEQQKDVANYGAEIEVHPNGKFLYISNRGHGSINSFRIVDSSGTLEKIECFDTVGTWPRVFAIHPTGELLLCAEQFKNVVEVLAIDKDSGKLQKIFETECKNSPSSIVFMKAK